MIDNHIQIGGLMVLWNLTTWTNRQSLKDGLGQAGFGKWVPERRTPQACLKDALAFTHRGRDFDVQRLEKGDGYEVIEITRGKVANSYRAMFSATIDEVRRITFHPYAPNNQSEILDSFNTHRGLLRAASVTECLVSIIKHLGGTNLPGGKGVYFLNPARLDAWRPAADAVEAAGYGRANAVYTVKHIMDESAMKAVRDAIQEEIVAEARKINEAVSTGELGERALAHRQAEAIAMRNKIAEYERLLNQSLGHLREAVDEAESAAMKAAILSAGATVNAT